MRFLTAAEVMAGVSLKAILYFDGASQGNPGKASFGIAGTIGNQPVTCGAMIGVATNNVAEWRGVLEALRLAIAHHVTDLEMRGDSELVVNQFNGKYKVKSDAMKRFYDEAKNLAKLVQCVTCTWVPRSKNLADAPAQAALRRPPVVFPAPIPSSTSAQSDVRRDEPQAAES